MWTDRCAPRRRKPLSPRRDAPAWTVFLEKIDGSGADDLAVLDENEQRPTIGEGRITGRSVLHPGAFAPPGHLDRIHQGAEPYKCLVAAALRDLEVLQRIDQKCMVGLRREHLACRCGIHEDDLGIGFDSGAPAPGHAATGEIQLPREVVVPQSQLDDPAPASQMLAHGWKHACGEAQGGRDKPKDEYKKVYLHDYVNPELDYAGRTHPLTDWRSRSFLGSGDVSLSPKRATMYADSIPRGRSCDQD